MKRYVRQKGFSLVEVLMATGILAMGLMLVAMAFPVGVKLVSVSTERTIGDAAIGEAVAKMRLYGVRAFTDPNWSGVDPNTACTDYEVVCATDLPANERYYPSLVPMPEEKRYCWSILVRRADPNTNEVQTTVLVCRMMGMGAKYYDMDAPPLPNNDNSWPVPVRVQVQKIGAGNRQLKIMPVLTGSPEYNFFTEGCKIIEDTKGQICRVLELRDVDSDGKRDLILQDDYAGPTLSYVWVVPPAVGGSRNPCISMWQSNLTFP
jgi:prepilin-type N-terminal cleavage/methylation domain-containing protein